MPRGRKPDGEHALSNAERQARYRANRMTAPVEVATRPRRPADRRSRPQRWYDAVKELLDLQTAYADWLAILPDGLYQPPLTLTRGGFPSCFGCESMCPGLDWG